MWSVIIISKIILIDNLSKPTFWEKYTFVHPGSVEKMKIDEYN